MSRDTNVLLIFQPDDKLRDYLEEGARTIKNIKLSFVKHSSGDEILRLAPDADIIVGWRPTDELLKASRKLRLFINPGAGVQHLIKKFQTLKKERGIILINGHGNSYFAAQHAVALLLTLMNKVVPHHLWMSKGKWRTGDNDAISIPLKNRKVGLCGYGAINRKVHRFLSGFEIEFSAYRKSWQGEERELPTPVEKYREGELHQFLKKVDTLIIALPSTSSTRNLFGKKEFELLGGNGLLINVGRGDALKEADFYDVLINKTISGAAIDVWFNYKPETDKKGRKYPFSLPFQDLENIVLSPHRAASPMNDLERWNEVIENIRRFAEGNNSYINVVDLEKEY